MTQKQVNEIAYKIVGCAIEVHKYLCPGLFESVYQVCLVNELKMIVLNYQRLSVPSCSMCLSGKKKTNLELRVVPHDTPEFTKSYTADI